MRTTYISNATRLKVGFFTLGGLALIVLFSLMVNNRPYWWRPCQLVRISVEDATGLKTKSPVRSLGIDIGYLKSVGLTETHVSLGICITAPVEVLPETRAYIRGEGFLGDKFVELKPVRYTGPIPNAADAENGTKSSKLFNFLNPIPSAYAEESVPRSKSLGNPLNSAPAKDSVSKHTRQAPGEARKIPRGREIPVEQENQDIEQVVTRVDELVNEVTGLANNLKEAINPEDLKKTMRQLNVTLENASKTLAPEGGLNQTAQRTLAKLEDAIEQLRDQLTRVNQGKGSLGMLLNDPSYAEELHTAVKNLNRLLNKVNDILFVVDIGAAQIPAYNGARAWFNLSIWPKPERYYLLGIAIDPRGRITNQAITTTAGGFTQTIQTQLVEQTGLLFTAMLGKIYYRRVDLSIGALYGDGAASVGLRLGPPGNEEKIIFRNDIYVRTSASSIDDRISLTYQPIPNFYLRAGFESIHRQPVNNRVVYFYAAGITFTDEDIKLLFALK